MVNLALMSKEKSQEKATRGGSFSEEESLQLMKAWVSKSVNPEDGNEMKRDMFAQSVLNQFNDNMKKKLKDYNETRTITTIKTKFSLIMRACQLFQSVYEQIEASKPSGTNRENWITSAKEVYLQRTEKSFKYMDCWIFLISSEAKAKFGSFCKSINQQVQNLSQDNDENATPGKGSFSSSPNSSTRPIGNKRAVQIRNAESSLKRAGNVLTAIFSNQAKKSGAERERALQLDIYKQEKNCRDLEESITKMILTRVPNDELAENWLQELRESYNVKKAELNANCVKNLRNRWRCSNKSYAK